MSWRRQWHSIPVLLPGKSHGQRSLVSCSPWGRKALDMTERLHFHFHFHALEKEMATHSSVLAWNIPGMAEPGGLPSMGSHRVGHDWSDLAVAAVAAAAARCLVHLDCGLMIKSRWLEEWAQRGQWLVDFEVHFRVEWEPSYWYLSLFPLGPVRLPRRVFLTLMQRVKYWEQRGREGHEPPFCICMASQSLFGGMIPTPSLALLFSDPQVFWFSLQLGRGLSSLSLSLTSRSTWKYRYLLYTVQFSSVQSLSRVRLLVTPWIAARQASLSITNSRSSLKLMSIESVMPSSHLILGRPLLPLPPVPPSIRVFSNESTFCTRWPKYWTFSFSIIPSKEIPGLISFRMDWLDLLAVQGTLKSLLQHHSSKASILRCSDFSTVQFTSIHDYWKNHSLH